LEPDLFPIYTNSLGPAFKPRPGHMVYLGAVRAQISNPGISIRRLTVREANVFPGRRYAPVEVPCGEPKGSSGAPASNVERWRKVGEVSVLILKILAAVSTVTGAFVSSCGCGPA